MSELILQNGDYVYDGAGGFKRTASDGDRLLRRCLTKLIARRGGSPIAPGFGSRLYTLGTLPASERGGAAARFAAEALDGEPVSVTSAAVTPRGDGGFDLSVALEYNGGADYAELTAIVR